MFFAFMSLANSSIFFSLFFSYFFVDSAFHLLKFRLLSFFLF